MNVGRQKADYQYGDVVELNCPGGCIEMLKAFYHCDPLLAMNMSTHESLRQINELRADHLMCAKDICDGYERCALQAIGGIFDLGAEWEYCQREGRANELWIDFQCVYPTRKNMRSYRWRRIERRAQYSRQRFYRRGLTVRKRRPYVKCVGFCTNVVEEPDEAYLNEERHLRAFVDRKIDVYEGGKRPSP